MRGQSRAVGVSVLAALAACVMAGCGDTPGLSGPRRQFAMDVEIVGQASCHDAMTVERDYSRALASGKVPGNGGGAPVTIQGWICQGYDTPRVLATGRASACRKHGSQILAVLPSISPSPPA